MEQVNLNVGDVIPTISKEGNPIATTTGKQNDYVCRIVRTAEGKWFGVSDPNYKGDGLVVFVKKKLTTGERLQITLIRDNFAVAVILPEDFSGFKKLIPIDLLELEAPDECFVILRNVASESETLNRINRARIAFRPTKIEDLKGKGIRVYGSLIFDANERVYQLEYVDLPQTDATTIGVVHLKVIGNFGGHHGYPRLGDEVDDKSMFAVSVAKDDVSLFKFIAEKP